MPCHLCLGISEVSSKLGNSIALGSDAFVAEVQEERGKKNLITAAGLRSLRDEHAHTIEPARLLAAEACNWNTASTTWSTKPTA